MYVYIWTHLAYVCIYVWIFKLYNQFSKNCICHRVSKSLNLYHTMLCNHMVSRDVTMRPQWICWSWWKSSHCYSWEFCNLYFDYFFLIIKLFSNKIIYIDIIYNCFLEIILLIWCWVSLCAHFTISFEEFHFIMIFIMIIVIIIAICMTIFLTTRFAIL